MTLGLMTHQFSYVEHKTDDNLKAKELIVSKPEQGTVTEMRTGSSQQKYSQVPPGLETPLLNPPSFGVHCFSVTLTQ